jgi:hypothetical protein
MEGAEYGKTETSRRARVELPRTSDREESLYRHLVIRSDDVTFQTDLFHGSGK